MVTIFLDECGFTGEELTSSEQPVFVLASHDLPDAVCAELKELHFGSVRAAELKHTSLQKRPRQQQMVARLLGDLTKRFPGSVKCDVVHKKYVLVAKMVDHLVEPVAHHAGFDLYERGANIALTNLMWLTLPVFSPPGFLDRLLGSFERMMRERTLDAYDAFFRPLFVSGYREELEELLTYLRGFHLEFGPDGILDRGKGDLDVSMTCALNLMSRWRKQHPLPTEIQVVHDASSNMAKDKPVWDALLDPSVPPHVTGYDRRTREFPIAVKSTTFASSQQRVGLQIADVVAGSVARAAGMLASEEGDDPYGASLVELVNGTGLITDTLWPGEGVTPAQLGTDGPKHGDLLEDTAAILHAAGVKLMRRRGS